MSSRSLLVVALGFALPSGGSYKLEARHTIYISHGLKVNALTRTRARV